MTQVLATLLLSSEIEMHIEIKPRSRSHLSIKQLKSTGVQDGAVGVRGGGRSMQDDGEGNQSNDRGGQDGSVGMGGSMGMLEDSIKMGDGMMGTQGNDPEKPEQKMPESKQVNGARDKDASPVRAVTLVLLTGQPRGGKLAWHSLKKNVLAPLHADLAVLFQEPFDRSTAVVRMAKYVFSLPTPRAWRDILDRAEAKCQNRAAMPRRYMDYCNLNSSHKLLQSPDTNPLHVHSTLHMLDPVCSGPGEPGPGSSAIRLSQIWVLSERISESQLWDKYSFFIHTRTDHVHLCPHPPPEFFRPRHAHIFTFGTERYGGYTDRHMAGFTDAFRKAINVTQELVCAPMACANVETCLGIYWPYSGLTVSEQSHSLLCARTRRHIKLVFGRSV